VLGASSYTYAEATRTQKVADFTASNARAFVRAATWCEGMMAGAGHGR
jgi:hypothetical protein